MRKQKVKQKVVLAFSGGLDTSYCIKYLSLIKKLEVHSVLINTGGFSRAQLVQLQNRARQLGVKVHKTIDVTRTYYQNCIRYLVYGNILRNHTYPLSVSAERAFQAMAVARYALDINADYLAHGSTGAGNDQVRFDVIFNILAPGIPVLTPIRDLKLSRDEEIRFLQAHHVQMDWQKSKYSVNQGLWGTSIGGRETLTSGEALPEEAYPTRATKTKTIRLELHFKKGEFCGHDSEYCKDPVEAIKKLNGLAAPFGIGRDIHTGDTIIGIKGRVGFEAAAPLIILKSHEALEKHVLTKWQIHWKDQLANWYGMLIHEGQYLDPVMRNIEKFMQDTQKFVNGTVYVELAPYRFRILGIASPHDLMSSRFGRYGEMNLAWTGQDVRGFAKILSNQSMIFRALNKRGLND
jgi:argininosuccinate synthase